MNILLFAPFAGSAQYGMIYRNYALARAWVKQGHQVTLVASSFSHTRISQPEIKSRVTEQFIDGIRYLWVWGPVYRQEKSFGRIVSMILFTLQSFFLQESKDYDVVIASSPHPFSIYPAYKAARRCNAKLIYDIRDLWPLTLIQLGGLSGRHPFIRLMQHAEDFACRNADLVIAVPRGCEDYLLSRGLAAGKFLHIGNGAVLDGEHHEKLPDEYRSLLSTLGEGRLLIGYAGAIGQANALHALIDAVRDSDDCACCAILGQGGLLQDLKLKVKQEGLGGRIHFLPPVPKNQVADFLSLIDVAYLGLQKAPLYELGASPTKLNDYMLASKPVLYAVGDGGNPVEASGCGICCSAEDGEAIVKAVMRFAEMDKKTLDSMGQRGHEWCLEHQLVEVHARKILDRLGASQ